MSFEIHEDGLNEVLGKFQRAPRVVQKALLKMLDGVLLILWGSVPAYPPGLSETYVRQGTLGRSLGVSMEGTKLGQPSIMEKKKLGALDYTARFGTNLEYAPYVIDPDRQVSWARATWWHMKDVLKLAQKGVRKTMNDTGKQIAKFMNR